MSTGWPSETDKLFVSVTANDDPNSWLDSMRREKGLAAAYKASAELIIESILSREVVERDGTRISPIIYLYRHSIELILKGIITAGVELGLLKTTPKLQDDLKNHRLHQLWNHAKSAIQSYWPDGDRAIITRVERIIGELHRVDVDGQTFRYAKDKSGHYNDHHSIVVNLPKMRTAFSKTFTFLESCCSAMDDGHLQ